MAPTRGFGAPTRGLGAPMRVLGLALAGGRSRRMGRDKAWIEFEGEPLAARALRRLAPQVAAIGLSVREPTREFKDLSERFGAALLPDDPAHVGAGPLAALAAGLRHARAAGFDALATVPCDAPFFPLDVVACLTEGFTKVDGGALSCLARSARGIEPAFGLWRLDALPAVETALERPGAALRDAFVAADGVEIAFAAATPDPFLNLNAPDDVERARARARIASDEP